MSDLYVSWEQYHQQIERLASTVYQSGWQFNQIVCLAKGGLRVGDIFSRLFHQPLAILSAAAYGGEDNRRCGEVIFSKHLSMTAESLGNRVLLVDDLVDSGITLDKAIDWLREYHAEEIEKIRTAVIWYKACSRLKPDYYLEYLPDNPWIHQPFEIYESRMLIRNCTT
ncbi:MAG: phosphoribosyltransferase [Snowella sp.]